MFYFMQTNFSKILIFILIIIGVISVWEILTPKVEVRYDHYQCIIEKVLNDCEGKDIRVSNTSYKLGDKQGNFALLKPDYVNEEFLKNFLIEKEEELINAKAARVINSSVIVLSCIDPSSELNFTEQNSLLFKEGYFLWKERAIDCAWIKKEYSLINSIISFNINVVNITIFSIFIGILLWRVDVNYTHFFFFNKKNKTSSPNKVYPTRD